MSLIIITSIIFLTFSGNITLFSVVLERLTTGNSLGVDSLTTGRSEIWRDYFKFFSSHLFSDTFGRGLGYITLNNAAAHNTYIDLLYQLGVVGTTCLLSIIAGGFKRYRCNYNRSIVNYGVLICIMGMYLFLSELQFWDAPFHFIMCFVALNIDFKSIRYKGGRKMRILIVCQLFEPMNEIGAVRPTKLATFLSKKGHKVDVFTSSDRINGKVEIDNKPYRLIYDCIIQNPETSQAVSSYTKKKSHRKEGKVIKEAKKTYRQLLSIKKGKVFAENFSKAIDESLINLSDYDFVFSTFGPIGSIYAGIIAKKRKKISNGFVTSEIQWSLKKCPYYYCLI